MSRIALDALRRGGAERAVVVISDAKTDVARVLGDGAQVGLSLGYVLQQAPEGLPGVIRCAAPWLGDDAVALVLPDTLFAPRDAIARLMEALEARGADVVLGVFPTQIPESLAPVQLRDGWVSAIWDKPAQPPAQNTWGTAVWRPSFTRFCAEWDRARTGDRERNLSRVFEDARRDGLKVAGVSFEDGLYLDGGTRDGLEAIQQTLDTWPTPLLDE